MSLRLISIAVAVTEATAFCPTLVRRIQNLERKRNEKPAYFAANEQILNDRFDTSSSSSIDDGIPDFIIADLDDEYRFPQCKDIVLDLDGNPLKPEYFADKLGIQVDSYSCPEHEAYRLLMSNACRIYLFPSKETVFYKRIVFKDHKHARNKIKTAPYKLKSDIESYKVVTSFLSSKACQAVIETAGVGIPKCYDAQLEPNDDIPIQSKFSFLIQDFSPLDGWYQQRWLLNHEECKATLNILAKFHAFFWNGSSFYQERDAVEELYQSVWESGSYIQPNRNKNQCENVAKAWKANKYLCEDELSCFDYWEDLGDRLQSLSYENGRLAHPFANEETKNDYQQFRTLIHGDPKQANYLFRQDSKALQVGMLDFQWCGFGLAATDIAHFMTSAVHSNCLNGGEDFLLKFYFDRLQQYLVEYGAFDSSKEALEAFTYETFQRQYETGVMDICRLVIAYAWSRFDPVDDQEDYDGVTRTMNKNSYNKSKSNVVWLMSRCDEIMKARGI